MITDKIANITQILYKKSTGKKNFIKKEIHNQNSKLQDCEVDVPTTRTPRFTVKPHSTNVGVCIRHPCQISMRTRGEILCCVLSHHVSAGSGKGHVSGVKLHSADGSQMLPIQHSDFHRVLCAPNMDSPVL